MSKRTWFLVGLVLGGGILLQIPSWGGHAEHHAADGHDHGSMAEAADAARSERPGMRTVALEVTGMT
ncbi:MAG: hypothetical protein ACE5HP_10810 [Gemmatimonadota bacterium]